MWPGEQGIPSWCGDSVGFGGREGRMTRVSRTWWKEGNRWWVSGVHGLELGTSKLILRGRWR
jgi:hypothetical protein